MRHSRLVTILIGALVCATALAPSAGAGVPTTDLQPEKLSRGADVSLPHIDKGILVDGTRRIDLPGAVASVLGRSGDALIVGTDSAGRKRHQRIVRVEADGTLQTILTGIDPWAVQVSEDGKRMAAVLDAGRKRAVVQVWSATSGEPLASRSFTGYPDVLAMRGNKTLILTQSRLVWWKITQTSTLPVTTKPVIGADIGHDLLWLFTKDPYRGGCTKLVRLSDPTTKVWRSCQDRVAEISPDGTQMATIDLLADGIGPGAVTLREINGTELAHWTSGWFGAIEWESPSTVLLGVSGKKLSATVRCTLEICENASDPFPTRQPRRVG